MNNNDVHLVGTVKRSAQEGSGVLDFAIAVENERGRLDIFDCRLTSRSKAWDELDGFVEEGEPIEVFGHLEKRTTTEEQRVNGVWMSVRNTVVFIYVDDVSTED